MNYPNGKKYEPQNIEKKAERKKYNIKDNASNRGMALEEDISTSLEFYNNQDLCLIYKRPTPIKVVRMDKINKSKICEAYFSEKSTTDYNGLYKGKYLDFEAKESINKTSFPFHNIRPQQITHLQKVMKLGGIAFFVIRLKAFNQTYLLKFSDLEPLLKSNRASVPLDFIFKNGILIEESFLPRLKILDAIDSAFFS